MRYAARGEDDPLGKVDRTLMREGTDLEGMIASAMSSFGFYMVKRKMNKLGAPPWIAYGVAMIDWTLTGIGIALATRNRYMIGRHYSDMGYGEPTNPRKARPMPAASADGRADIR